MTKQTPLTRTCTACGIEKPLAAFLQLSGSLGTHYGAICASCRAAGKTAQSNLSYSEEDATTDTTDKRIGTKEKVYEEQEKKRLFRELKESHIKEAKKREEQAQEKAEKDRIRKKAEQSHRKFYLDLKPKEGFLAQKKPQESQLSETEKKAQQQHEHGVVEDYKKETQRQEEIIKQEFQMTSLDFSKPFISGQTNQLRFQSDTFLKFKSWIGTSSPLVMTLERLYGKHASTHTAENKKSNAKENIEQYIDNRLNNPSSSRKR